MAELGDQRAVRCYARCLLDPAYGWIRLKLKSGRGGAYAWIVAYKDLRLITEVAAWQRQRNASCARIIWMFTRLRRTKSTD
jgi:hypothetical protein